MGMIARALQRIGDVFAPPLVVTQLGGEGAGFHFDSPPRPIDQLISEMLSGGWGSRVSREQALSIPAVLRGRNELCSIATLPLRQYRGLDVVPSAFLAQLDLNVANVVTLASLVEDLLFEGIAWWHIVGRDFDRYPLAVEHCGPGRVTLQPPTSATAVPLTPSGNATRAASGPTVWLDGIELPARDFIRFDSPNPGLLHAGSRPIRKALLLDALAATFADNPRPLDYFTDSDEAIAGTVEPMEDPEVRDFLAEWRTERKRASTAWIPGTVKRVDVDTPSPVDLQLVELQRQATLELANSLGVDPEDLGVSTTSRTYFNGQDRDRNRINRTLSPYLTAITDRLSMGDVTRRGYLVDFDLADYLKADPATQVAYWRGLYDMGAISEDEVRAAAGFSGPAPRKAATPATSETTPAPATSSAPLVALPGFRPAARFADDRPAFTFAAADFAGDAPAVEADEGARTIEGLALPYNAIARRFGVAYRFKPGALEYGDVTRVKHLQDHWTPVGSAIELADRSEPIHGLYAKLGVGGGPEGSPVKLARDQLLHDAKAGLYDGMSVGVDFSLYPEDGDVVFNEDDNVYDVVRASLREISTTPMPAFDDARVTKVAASTRGGAMHCPHCGRDHAPGIACATFARQAQAAAAEAAQRQLVGAGVGASSAPGVSRETPVTPVTSFSADQLNQLAALLAQHSAGDGAVTVDATRRPAVEVREPSPYRFDRYGNLRKGTHDFSSDLFLGWQHGDLAARARAEHFVQEAFAARDLGNGQTADETFAITPANVSALNYPANRPDLYVDQLDFQYPLVAGTNKGVLQDVTPFVIPKYSSSSGLVADHVTGTEPTPGTFVATAQTITPSAVSGKVEITREAFDQGGNPQMSGLIWKQMVRGWYEALEAFVQAQLVANAASITDLTLTTAAVDSALDQLIANVLSPLQYIRGGDRYRNVYTQVDLYKVLINAKDSTGRRLYPAYNPMNAAGQSDPRLSWVEAHGKLWIPTWATAASSTVAASSWMFDPDVVCLWATLPQKIELAWRVAWVDLGLFGYKAFGVTDFTRTREVIYDPV